MQRAHLFEFNERPGVPAFIRETIVETLGTGLRWSGMGEIAGPAFAEFAAAAGASRVVDLCSGTGVPVSLLIRWLEAEGLGVPAFQLTDLFPHLEATAIVAAAHPGVEAIDQPLDATAVPPELEHDARTLFNAFHHFPPEVARRILADAVEQERAIFVYEGFPRNPLRLTPTMPYMAASMMTHPLRTKEQRLPKALLTWLLPIIPAAGLWDAFASSMRVHDEDDLRAMVEPLNPAYRWEYREIPYSVGGLATAFWGIPPGHTTG